MDDIIEKSPNVNLDNHEHTHTHYLSLYFQLSLPRHTCPPKQSCTCDPVLGPRCERPCPLVPHDGRRPTRPVQVPSQNCRRPNTQEHFLDIDRRQGRREQRCRAVNMADPGARIGEAIWRAQEQARRECAGPLLLHHFCVDPAPPGDCPADYCSLQQCGEPALLR